MVKQRSEAEHQRMAKVAIKSTRKTTIKKPARLSRKEHAKKSTLNALWVVIGIVVCVVIVASAVFIIDWLVYKHSCDYESKMYDELVMPSTQCRRHSIFFLEEM